MITGPDKVCKFAKGFDDAEDDPHEEKREQVHQIRTDARTLFGDIAHVGRIST